jgi:hypothetical protein
VTLNRCNRILLADQRSATPWNSGLAFPFPLILRNSMAGCAEKSAPIPPVNTLTNELWNEIVPAPQIPRWL